jgi:hypothetical protein
MLRSAVVLLAALLWQTVACGADYIRYAAAGDEEAAAADANGKTTANGCVSCDPQACGDPCGNACGGCGTGCGGRNCGCPDCDECPRIGVVGLLGFDSFRGVSDGDYQSNFGLVTGANLGIPVPVLNEMGLGWQLGATYGIYDWDGRTTANRSDTQQQTFITTGIFRKGFDGRRLSFGLVYDWMANSNWGYQAVAPTLGQWRGQAEYAMSNCNALGVMGTLWDRQSLQTLPNVTVLNRPVNQLAFFWHHKFAKGADSRLWFGFFPDNLRLNGDGSLYDTGFGGDLTVPLTSRLALYANFQYVHPSAAAGSAGSIENSYNVGMGLVFYPGRNARSRNINGGCWMPYMPVANNSTFLVDQSITAVTQPVH